jgi:hypothetical protein
MTIQRGRDRSALRYCHRNAAASCPHSGKRRCGETRLEGAYFRLIPTAVSCRPFVVFPGPICCLYDCSLGSESRLELGPDSASFVVTGALAPLLLMAQFRVAVRFRTLRTRNGQSFAKYAPQRIHR